MNKILKLIGTAYASWNFNGHKIYFMGNKECPIWYQLGNKRDLLLSLQSLRQYDSTLFHQGKQVYRIYMPWGPVDIS